MKKLLLILMLVVKVSAVQRIWSSAGSTVGEASTNWSGSGSLLTTDTLLFNGTSVVNCTFGADVSVAQISTASGYSGTLSMSGRSVVVQTGLDWSGEGNVTLSNASITFTGSGAYRVGSVSGTITATGTVLTFHGNDTIALAKSVTIGSKLVSTGRVTLNSGAYNTTVSGSGDSLIVLGGNGVIDGGSQLWIINSTSAADIIAGNMVNYKLSNMTVIQSSSLTDAVIEIPEIQSVAPWMFCRSKSTATTTFNLHSNIVATTLYIRVLTSGGNIVLKTNKNNIYCVTLNAGSLRSGYTVTIDSDSSIIQAGAIDNTSATTDSAYIIGNGMRLKYLKSTHTKLRVSGIGIDTSYSYNDLFMGHSMFAGGAIMLKYLAGSEDKYGVNRAVSGSNMSNAEGRVDSCLTAYQPNRVFLWMGQNDFDNYTTSGFATQMATYWPRWKSFIDKCKTFGVDSIYCLEMSPTGTAANPMSAEKAIAYRLFNAILRDSCATNNLFFIRTYESLLADSETDYLDPVYSTDGLHPTTADGVAMVASLMGMAYTPLIMITTQPENDTVLSGQQGVFTVGYTGDSVQIAWYKNNVFTGVYGDTLRITGSNGDSVQAVLWKGEDTVSSSMAYLTVYRVVIDSTEFGNGFSLLNKAGSMYPSSGWLVRVVKTVGDTLNTTTGAQDEYGIRNIVPSEDLPSKKTKNPYIFIFSQDNVFAYYKLYLLGQLTANGGTIGISTSVGF